MGEGEGSGGNMQGTDGNGLTILSFLPGGVKWENVALVVETVIQVRPPPLPCPADDYLVVLTFLC